MKRYQFIALTSAALLALSLSACSSSSSDSTEITEKPITEPSMGTAKDIPASDGTIPTSDAAAINLLTGALSAIDTATSDSKAALAAPVSRYSESSAEPVSYSSEDGKITESGTMITNVWTTDEDIDVSNLKANTTYPWMKMHLYCNLTGTIAESTMTDSTDSTVTYTVSGKFIENFSYDFNMSFVTDDDPTIYTLTSSVAVDMGFGLALSVKNNKTEEGAKFLISFKKTDSVDDTSLTQGESPLDDTDVDLKVYNDADELKYETTVKLSALAGFSPSDFISDDEGDIE